MEAMRVAVVQTNPVFGNVDKNIQEALSLMQGIEADLFVLPELFATGYNFVDAGEALSLSEEATGKTFRALAQFAKEHQTYVSYGFAERDGTDCYNSAAIAGPDGLQGLYRKIHLFNRETLFFAPGNLGFPVFKLPMGTVGLMVCFDWFYPESARTLALKGAQIIAHPSNLVLPYCPAAMVTRCLENRVFSATANRIGEENRGGSQFRYIGQSEIVSPRGEFLGCLGSEQAAVCVADVDLSLATNKQLNEFNSLLDGRRPDQYR
jgi:predicted amidohydrolase